MELEICSIKGSPVSLQQNKNPGIHFYIQHWPISQESYYAYLPVSFKWSYFNLLRYSPMGLRSGTTKQEPWQPRATARSTHFKQKMELLFQFSAPWGNIYIWVFDPKNANTIQLFTGRNTFHFHCYLNQTRLVIRKTNNCISNSREAGKSGMYFRKDENSHKT